MNLNIISDHSVAAEQYAAWFSWLKTQTTMSLPWTTQTAAPTLLVARADPPPPPYSKHDDIRYMNAKTKQL